MPIIKSAKKKLRKDKKRTKVNSKRKESFKKALKSVVKGKKKKGSGSGLSEAYSKIDRAAKSKVIHKNKAARLKSKVSKLLKKNK